MSAIVDVSGVRQLDRQSQPSEQITEEQAKEPARVARLLMALLQDVATLKRRWWPRAIVHRDRVVDSTGTTVYRFPHNFDGRVEWWPVDWTAATAGPRLVRHSSTDNNTLALVSYTAGTLTLRVQEAG